MRLHRIVACVGMVVAAGAMTGCLLPKPDDNPVRTFVLTGGETDRAGVSPAAQTGAQGVLVVGVPQAAPGFDQPRMAYLRRPSEVSYYATHLWVDTPSRMLMPLVIRSLESTGVWRIVLPMPTGIRGDYRLDLSGLLVQQEFLEQPSRSRVQLRASLTDVNRQLVLGARNFEALEPAPTEDAYGGVLAANRATEAMLRALMHWVTACMGGTRDGTVECAPR